MIRQIFCISLICLLSSQNQCLDIGKSKTKVSMEDISQIFKGFSNVQSAFDLAQLVYKKMKNIPTEGQKTDEYLHKLSADLQNVMTLNVQIFDNSKEILRLMRSGPERNLLTIKMNVITTLMSRMRRYFDSYLDHKNELTVRKYVTPAVKSFVDILLDRHTSKVIQVLGSIQDQIGVHNGNEYKTGVLPLMLNHLQDFTALCNTNKSMNMISYETYEAIRNTEVIANTVVLFAYDIYQKSNSANDGFNSTKTLMDTELIRTENKINAAFKSALQKSSRAVWTCSPINPYEVNQKWTSLNDGIKGDGRIYINLEPVKADVSKSMVVTGARFARKLFIDVGGKSAVELCIEIQQGKLLDNGTIDASTLQWKDSSSIANPRRTGFRLGSTEFSLWAQDFHDILDGKYPIVLSGLALKEIITDRFILQAYGSHVIPPADHPVEVVNKFIEADSFVTPEKSNNGRLIHVKSVTDMNLRYSEPIQELFKTQSSNLATEPFNIIKRYNADVRFDRSKNTADKMLVPFIDLSSAVTDPPMPLSGVGMYYKTTTGFSGIIGIELHTLSLARSIPDEVTLPRV